MAVVSEVRGNPDVHVVVFHENTGQREVDHFEAVNNSPYPLLVVLEFPVGTEVYRQTFPAQSGVTQIPLAPEWSGMRWRRQEKLTNFGLSIGIG